MRILVLSDVHGNLPAIEAVLEGERFDEIVVPGDLVDYGPFPGEVIDVLRSIGARTVRGNHDHAVGYGVDCMCGEATHWLSVWFRENITNRLLSDNDKKYLAGLPMYLERDDTIFVHGSPYNPLYDYLYPWLGHEALLERTARPAAWSKFVLREARGKQGYKRVYVGHTHIQFMVTLDSTRIVNPGSAGQPRDGDPRAGYAVVEDDTVLFRRVEYPVMKVVRRYEELKMPDPYYSFLRQLLLTGKLPPRQPAPNTGTPADTGGLGQHREGDLDGV